jgi:hypothetical protein
MRTEVGRRLDGAKEIRIPGLSMKPDDVHVLIVKLADKNSDAEDRHSDPVGQSVLGNLFRFTGLLHKECRWHRWVGRAGRKDRAPVIVKMDNLGPRAVLLDAGILVTVLKRQSPVLSQSPRDLV